ncbi:MAG: NAD-dependent epimerase [Candidatus Saccharibacteria bacterium]|nr:NAD-dependent epimerase [Candidatus Saccharibacteria bacterium]
MPINASSKQLTVFGANGRVGKLVVREALARGYHVVAFVHRHHDFAANPQLTVVRGTIYNRDDVHRAIKGSNAVISALGSWGTPKKDVLSAGMANIIPAMQAQGISRIVSLTGADARVPEDTISLIHQLTYMAITIFAPKIIRDSEKHIAQLHASELDWTVVRSPVMMGGKKTAYHLSAKRPYPWSIVRRHAVATALVELIDNGGYFHGSPFVQNG